MSKKYSWRSVLYISIVKNANENVRPQDALTISSNLAQSSALVEAKRFQIATEKIVNLKSTSSHLQTVADKNNILYPVVKTDNKISIHLQYSPNHTAANPKGDVKYEML